MSSEIACPACGGESFEALESICTAEQHALYAPLDRAAQARFAAKTSKSAAKYQLHRCTVCSLEFCDPLIAPAGAWYQLVYQSLPLYPADRWEFSFVLDQLSGESSVFEFGCGSGAFLEKCRDRGIRAEGVDFSERAVAACRLNGLSADVMDVSGYHLQSPARPVSEVVAFQVLEHLDRPAELFRYAAQASTPGAKLWVGVPSCHRPSRVLGEVDCLDQPPHHMTRWTAAALARMGERENWRLEGMVYEPISWRSAAWWMASRSNSYLCLKKLGWLKPRSCELLSRLMLLPYCGWSRLTWAKRMTGESMIARFQRT